MQQLRGLSLSLFSLKISHSLLQYGSEVSDKSLEYSLSNILQGKSSHIHNNLFILYSIYYITAILYSMYIKAIIYYSIYNTMLY